MNDKNTRYLGKQADILAIRDLSAHTVATYIPYMTQFMEWTESSLGGKDLADVISDELLTYVKHLKVNRKLNPRTINVHIAQLRDFYQYVLQINWGRYQIPTLKYFSNLF